MTIIAVMFQILLTCRLRRLLPMVRWRRPVDDDVTTEKSNYNSFLYFTSKLSGSFVGMKFCWDWQTLVLLSTCVDFGNISTCVSNSYHAYYHSKIRYKNRSKSQSYIHKVVIINNIFPSLSLQREIVKTLSKYYVLQTYSSGCHCTGARQKNNNKDYYFQRTLLLFATNKSSIR